MSDDDEKCHSTLSCESRVIFDYFQIHICVIWFIINVMIQNKTGASFSSQEISVSASISQCCFPILQLDLVFAISLSFSLSFICCHTVESKRTLSLRVVFTFVKVKPIKKHGSFTKTPLPFIINTNLFNDGNPWYIMHRRHMWWYVTKIQMIIYLNYI